MPTTDAEARDVATLRQLNDRFIAALTDSDVGWFERHLAPDFLNSNPDGTLSDRADFLRRVAQRPSVTRLAAEDVRIRLFGQTAIVHARTVYAKAEGQPGHGRYTDVWARAGESWLCVAADVTRC